MRLIDADKLPVKFDGHCVGVWKNDLDEAPTVKAIPIEWIVDWLTKQHIPATHTCDDYYAVEMMLDDWEKENEQNKENTSQTD